MTKLDNIALQILSLVLVFICCSNLQAALVSNDQVINQIDYAIDKETLLESIQQVEVQAKFIKLGINQSDVEARIGQLTHSEINELNAKMSELPAGSGAAGLLVTVFIVFVITDVIGATDIFPFIRPIS